MLGRPTVMTTETMDKLREAYLMGSSDREACIYADIGLQTLYDYQKDHPGFSEQKELYKLNPILKARKTIYDELEKGNVKISMWYLERKVRDEFSTKKEINVKPLEGEIEKTIDDLERNDTSEGGFS